MKKILQNNRFFVVYVNKMKHEKRFFKDFCKEFNQKYGEKEMLLDNLCVELSKYENSSFKCKIGCVLGDDDYHVLHTGVPKNKTSWLSFGINDDDKLILYMEVYKSDLDESELRFYPQHLKDKLMFIRDKCDYVIGEINAENVIMIHNLFNSDNGRGKLFKNGKSVKQLLDDKKKVRELFRNEIYDKPVFSKPVFSKPVNKLFDKYVRKSPNEYSSSDEYSSDEFVENLFDKSVKNPPKKFNFINDSWTLAYDAYNVFHNKYIT